MKRAVTLWVVAALWTTGASGQQATLRFDFGPGPAADGTMTVPPEAVYSDAVGYGFEPGAKIEGIDRGGDPLTGDFCTSAEPFYFSVAVPEEGNYRVTVTLGDRDAESVATIKAELRRLMVKEVRTEPSRFATVSFLVNTHHNNYGAYELAQCVVQGIRDNRLDLAKAIVDDIDGFDPSRPDPLDGFAVPARPIRPAERPPGQ